MKKLLRFLFVAVMGLSVLSCYDDSALREAVDKHEQMLMDLQDRCAEMNADIESLQTLIAVVQNADYITSITPITEGGKEVGYTIVFAKYGTVTIKNGADGAKGEDGKPIDAVPVIGAKQDTDGVYYWTVDGEWLTDDAGNKVPASGKDGADGEKGDQGAPGIPGADGSAGAPGVDGVTPELKIEQDYWYVSYDGGKTWTQLGRATGEDGKDGANGGDSIFKDVYEKDGYVCFVLSDGTTYKVPMTATAAPAALDITFDVESEMFVVPDKDYLIPYTIIGADDKTSVRVITNPSYVRAYVIPETGSTGSISVCVAPNYGWESEEFYQSQLSFMVTVMDGRGNSVVKAINLKKGILSLYESAYVVEKEGGQLSVSVKTNMEYEVVVPSETTWLTYSPKTKSEIRTDELLFNVQPNEEKTSRSTEVYLVDNDGNNLESIYIYQRGNGIVIDGDFSDWQELDENEVAVSTCAPDTYRNGLKTMMAFADGENLNVYLEMDFDVVVGREEWDCNPVDICLSYSSDTGGFYQWSDMCVDYMLEFNVLSSDLRYTFDDLVSLFSWGGGIHDDGWAWDNCADVQVQVARYYNVCEIAINQRVLEELSGTPIDKFSIGAAVNQQWEWVGVLPNATITDSNLDGRAPMLALNGENSDPLPPVEVPEVPRDASVGVIGNFNDWADDVMMYDNGDDWYVAEISARGSTAFVFRLNRGWEFTFYLPVEYGTDIVEPGVEYNLSMNEGLNMYCPYTGKLKIYVSKDFTRFKYDLEEYLELISGGSMEVKDAKYWTVKDYWMMAEDWSGEVVGVPQFVHEWGAPNGPSGGKGGCLRLGGESQFMQYSFRSTVYQPIYLEEGDVIELTAQVKWEDETVDNGFMFWCITQDESRFGFDDTSVLEMFNYWSFDGWTYNPLPAWEGNLGGYGLHEDYGYSFRDDVYVNENGGVVYTAPSSGTYYVGFEVRSVWGNCWGKGKDYYIDEISVTLLDR